MVLSLIAGLAFALLIFVLLAAPRIVNRHLDSMSRTTQEVRRYIGQDEPGA